MGAIKDVASVKKIWGFLLNVTNKSGFFLLLSVNDHDICAFSAYPGLLACKYCLVHYFEYYSL